VITTRSTWPDAARRDKVLIELVNADHQVFPGQARTVTFTVPGNASHSR